jgi:hypothetical protein
METDHDKLFSNAHDWLRSSGRTVHGQGDGTSCQRKTKQTMHEKIWQKKCKMCGESHSSKPIPNESAGSREGWVAGANFRTPRLGDQVYRIRTWCLFTCAYTSASGTRKYNRKQSQKNRRTCDTGTSQSQQKIKTARTSGKIPSKTSKNRADQNDHKHERRNPFNGGGARHERRNGDDGGG